MYYQPTPINWQNFHFLITSAPDDQSMKKFIKVSVLAFQQLTLVIGLESAQCEAACEDLREDI
jgi:hypothetical protein